MFHDSDTRDGVNSMQPDESHPVAPALLTTIVRQILVAGGSWAVGKGYITGEDAIQWGGAAVGIAGAIWGLYSRYKNVGKLNKAIAAPAGKAE